MVCDVVFGVEYVVINVVIVVTCCCCVVVVHGNVLEVISEDLIRFRPAALGSCCGCFVVCCC